MSAEANAGKALEVEVTGSRFQRIPVKTRLIGPDDDIVEVAREYARDLLVDGDVLFITEKIVAITQGRAYPVDEIRPRRLATVLSGYVTKTPAGIGLGMPETMEMALRECGTSRILLAAAVAAITKRVGRTGDFYRVAGWKAQSIDGPTSGTIPPYDSHVVLAPAEPARVAARVRAALGARAHVLISDINDLGGNILGSTMDAAGTRQMLAVLQDNPLGQGAQSTPLGIIRRLS